MSNIGNIFRIESNLSLKQEIITFLFPVLKSSRHTTLLLEKKKIKTVTKIILIYFILTI
jgi:hypothetical protein